MLVCAVYFQQGRENNEEVHMTSPYLTTLCLHLFTKQEMVSDVMAQRPPCHRVWLVTLYKRLMKSLRDRRVPV